MKSGNLNFLEPSGPLQACNGTALPLPKGTDIDKVGSGLRKQNMDIVCEDINNLLVSERQILRKIFGPIQCKEGWRI